MQSETVGTLYAQFGDKVFGYILNRVQNYADAEDLRSEVFMKVMANIQGYDSAKAAYSTWIYTITRNAVIDHYRKKCPECLELDDARITEEEDTSRWEEYLPSLAEILAGCSQRERDIIILHYYHGYPHARIAEMLHLSSANVRMISYRALKKLRERLKGM